MHITHSIPQISGYDKDPIKFTGIETIWTYSWSKSINRDPTKEISHKILGHLFEVCDAFLDDYFNSCQVFLDGYQQFNLLEYQPSKEYILCPEVSAQIQKQIIQAIVYKYESEYQRIIFSHLIFDRPKMIKCKEIFITDGVPPEAIIQADHINLWLCSNDLWWKKSSSPSPFAKNAPRIENLIPKSGNKIRIFHSFHAELLKDFDPKEFYIKEVHPENLKPIRHEYYKQPQKSQPEHNLLIYATGNCRSLGEWFENATDIEQYTFLEDFKKVSQKFISTGKSLGYFRGILYLGDNNKDMAIIKRLHEISGLPITVIPERELPIMNLYDIFSVYYYTPLTKNWDCNPRLVQECYWLGKEVIYSKPVVDKINENLPIKYFKMRNEICLN